MPMSISQTTKPIWSPGITYCHPAPNSVPTSWYALDRSWALGNTGQTSVVSLQERWYKHMLLWPLAPFPNGWLDIVGRRKDQFQNSQTCSESLSSSGDSVGKSMLGSIWGELGQVYQNSNCASAFRGNCHWTNWSGKKITPLNNFRGSYQGDRAENILYREREMTITVSMLAILIRWDVYDRNTAEHPVYVPKCCQASR